jgi:hypothetical protein
MSLPWYWTPLLFVLLLAVPRVIAWCLRSDATGRPLRVPVQRPLFEPDSLAPAHAVLADFWARCGDHPGPCPKAQQAVCDLEQRYGVVLPEDFRAYLLTTAPAADYWDEGDGTWWSPERIRNIPEEYGHVLENPAIAARAERCLFFLDHLAWCWAWAICCEPGPDHGKVALIIGEGFWVADTFSDFVRAYTRDPMSVS